MPARKTGTWKMAYADFLTALMAFFLLMWLISGVSPETRADIAGYFTDRPAPETSLAGASPGAETANLIAVLARDAALAGASGNVRIAEDPAGVRIDLVDSTARPLFASGSGELTKAGHELAGAAGLVLATLPYELTLEGHTDAFASSDPDRTNWDISTDRANEARRALIAAGISPDRLRAVTGLASTQPLNPGQPHLSANRRVSILVHIDS